MDNHIKTLQYAVALFVQFFRHIGDEKSCINMTLNTDIQSGTENKEMTWSSRYATNDQKEGLKTFAEKRKPQFNGS